METGQVSDEHRQYGVTKLHLACHHGDLDATKTLVNEGVEIDSPDNDGWTPLMLASRNGHDSLVHWLLANPARRDAIRSIVSAHSCAHYYGQDKVADLIDRAICSYEYWFYPSGNEEMMEACREGYAVRLDLLVENAHISHVEINNEFNGWTPLMMAAERGHVDIIDVLLQYYVVDIDKQRCDGVTALSIACEIGQFAVVTTLVDNGAALELADNDGYTPLITAAQRGHSDVVEFLLSRGAKIDARLESGSTALLTAVWHKRIEVVRILLDRGADSSLCGDFMGWTPLLAAYFSGYTGLVQLTYESLDASEKVVEKTKHDPSFVISTQVDVKRSHGPTELVFACQSGNMKIVERILDGGYALLDLEDKYTGLTPLMIASKNGSADIVTFLLTKRVNVDKQEKKGNTSLFFASENGHLDVVQSLVAAGSNVDMANQDGWTPLMKAARGGHTAVITFLLSKGANVHHRNTDGGTALAAASARGKTTSVAVLLENQARVDVVDECGRTPLIVASQVGQPAVIKKLLDARGGKTLLDSQDNWGRTALWWASERGFAVVVLLLVESGAAMNLADPKGNTPLMQALTNREAEVTRVLLKYGANADIYDHDGFTALIRMCLRVDTEYARVLLENGVAVDFPDRNGRTALMIAAFEGDGYTVKYLLERGADTSLRSLNGDTAVHFACAARVQVVRGFYHTALEELVAAGAPVDVANNQGWTPLMVAATRKYGASEVVPLLKKGANINASLPDGSTALQIAREYHCEHVEAFLKANGALPGFDSELLQHRAEESDALMMPAIEAALYSTRNPNMYLDDGTFAGTTFYAPDGVEMGAPVPAYDKHDGSVWEW